MKKLVIFLLATCLLAGCSPKQEPQQVGPLSPEDKQREEMVSRLNIFSYSPDTLNPLFTKNNANRQMLHLLFEGLTKCNQQQQVVPVLAERYQVSADGLVWTVWLRQGVLFHDGAELTSADVEASYNAVLQSDSIYKPHLENVATLFCPDRYTIEIALKRPQTHFINLLDVPIVKAADATSNEGFEPIGTGPFLFDRQQPKRIVLTANQAWWGGVVPNIRTINVEMLPDQNTSTFAYEAKAIDVVNTETKGWGKYAKNAENTIAQYPSGNFHFIGLNQNNPFLADLELRQAMAHSIHKNRIFKEVLLSHGTLTDTCISPAWWMYNNAVPTYEYAPKLAVETVKKRGKTVQLELLVNDGNDAKKNVANIIKECFEEVGIELKVTIVPWERFLKRIEANEYDMYFGQINYSPEVNPACVLGDLPEYAPLLDDLQRQVTDEGRKAAYDAIQHKVAAELPLIPLYFDAAVMLYNNKLSGEITPIRTNLFDGIEKWHIKETR